MNDNLDDTLKLIDTRNMDEDMWLKTYMCPSHLDGSPLDLLVMRNACTRDQWAIVMTETSPYHLFLLVLFTSEGKQMNLTSLVDDHDDDNDNKITTDITAPSNPIARAISNGLYDQNLSCRITLDEQIVGEETVFTLVRISLDGHGYVIVDGQKWTHTMEKSFKALGLKLTSFEICHESKEWNTICCFVKCMPLINSTLKDDATALLHTYRDQNQLCHPYTTLHTTPPSSSPTAAANGKQVQSREWVFWGIGTVVGAVVSYYMSFANFI